DEQKEKLQEAREKAEKELQEKIAKLREEARDQVLGVLTSDQQTKFKKMIGEPFEFQSRSFGGRGGTGGGRGRGTGGGDRNRGDGN
ncbi:MAG: hypothetical protein N2C14_14885, partial [Planctomycetales bacterium]